MRERSDGLRRAELMVWLTGRVAEQGVTSPERVRAAAQEALSTFPGASVDADRVLAASRALREAEERWAALRPGEAARRGLAGAPPAPTGTPRRRRPGTAAGPGPPTAIALTPRDAEGEHGHRKGCLPTTQATRSAQRRDLVADLRSCHRGRLGKAGCPPQPRWPRSPRGPTGRPRDAPDPAVDGWRTAGWPGVRFPPPDPGHPASAPRADAPPTPRPRHREQRQEREQEAGRRRQPDADDLQPGPPGTQPGAEPGRGSAGAGSARGPQLDGQRRQRDPVLAGSARRRCNESRSASRRASSDSTATMSPIDVAWAEQRPHPRDAGLLGGDAAVEVDDLLRGVLGPARPAEHGAGGGEVVDEPVQAGGGHPDDQPRAGAVDLLLGDDPARRGDRGAHAAGGGGGSATWRVSWAVRTTSRPAMSGCAVSGTDSAG